MRRGGINLKYSHSLCEAAQWIREQERFSHLHSMATYVAQECFEVAYHPACADDRFIPDHDAYNNPELRMQELQRARKDRAFYHPDARWIIGKFGAKCRACSQVSYKMCLHGFCVVCHEDEHRLLKAMASNYGRFKNKKRAAFLRMATNPTLRKYTKPSISEWGTWGGRWT